MTKNEIDNSSTEEIISKMEQTLEGLTYMTKVLETEFHNTKKRVEDQSKCLNALKQKLLVTPKVPSKRKLLGTFLKGGKK